MLPKASPPPGLRQRNTMATLQDILSARDQRAASQRLLLERHRQPVLSMTVVMPGPVKRNVTSLFIAQVGSALIEESFKASESIVNDKETGFEALYAIPLPPEELKRMAVAIEDSHPLGRLLDLDVIAPDGTPLSREALGLLPRRCLVCGDHAHACVRSRRHTITEVLAVIERMVADYQHNQ